MAQGETGRPQDQGRSHKAKGRPSAETRSLLARYHAAMRDDLAAILDELEPRTPEPGLLPDVKAEPTRKPVKERAGLWDLAMRLGRELGAEIDPGPVADAAPARASGRRGRVDYG